MIVGTQSDQSQEAVALSRNKTGKVKQVEPTRKGLRPYLRDDPAMPAALAVTRKGNSGRRNDGPHVYKHRQHTRGKASPLGAGERISHTCPPKYTPQVPDNSQERTPPSQQPDYTDKPQNSAPSLTACPTCKELFVLTSDDRSANFRVTCKLCGVLPTAFQKLARSKQIGIVRAALTVQHEEMSQSTSKSTVKVDPKASEDHSYADRDEVMGGTTQTPMGPLDHHSDVQTPTQGPKKTGEETGEDREGEDAVEYDDDSDNAGEEKEEFEAPWLKMVLEKLDAKWDVIWYSL